MAFVETVRGDTAAGPAAQLCAGDVAGQGYMANCARVVAVMDFADHVVGNATSILGDIERLRAHGLSDTDILDVAAAAARCFVSTALDAVGARATEWRAQTTSTLAATEADPPATGPPAKIGSSADLPQSLDTYGRSPPFDRIAEVSVLDP